MTEFALPGDVHPAIQGCFRYWQEIHPEQGGLPGRRHFDPLKVPRLLPYIWLLEVHAPAATEAAASAAAEAAPRLRYRLLGSHLDLGLAGSRTGAWMEEVEPRFYERPDIHQPYFNVIRKKQPEYRRGPVRFAVNRGAAGVERLLLPLAADGEQVDMLLGCTIFFDSSGRELRATL